MKLSQHTRAVSIHDRQTIGRFLFGMLGHGNMHMLQQILRTSDRKYAKFMGRTSKYQPHQGAKETARRRLQLARGII